MNQGTNPIMDDIERFAGRTDRKAKTAIGWWARVRVDKTTTVVGRVIAASGDGATLRGRTVHGVFKITMECGPAKFRRTFRVIEVREIPTPDWAE